MSAADSSNSALVVGILVGILYNTRVMRELNRKAVRGVARHQILYISAVRSPALHGANNNNKKKVILINFICIRSQIRMSSTVKSVRNISEVVALVTGGASGLGRATAVRLASLVSQRLCYITTFMTTCTCRQHGLFFSRSPETCASR